MTKRFLSAVSLLACMLLAGCGGGGNAAPAPLPTETLPLMATSTLTAASESSETPVDDSNFPPGTRLSTLDPLAANGENNLTLLASVGDALVVGVEPGAGQDIALGLLQLTGTGPDERVAQANASAGFESLVYTFQRAGAYRLAIRELNGVAGQYALRVAGSPGVALAIAPQHQIEGMLADDSSVGYLHDGYVGRPATFDVAPAAGYADLDLRVTVVSLSDMSTVLLDVNDTGAGEAERVVFDSPAESMYYILVQSVNGSTGAFSLTMTEP